MMRRFLAFPLLLILLLPLVLAQQGHLTLLTVAEYDDPFKEPYGGTADLYLEIKPGNGNIFIDSFPLTKLDTQGSTRYANKVACDHLDIDCGRYDFFYTIRADSTLVGGPSAGAAFAVLTVALLDGRTVDESVAITGTITSGGIVGPVAGVKEKVEAAHEAGLSKVLISSFSYPTTVNRTLLLALNATNRTNASVNLSRLYPALNISELPIPVIEVATLDEALAYFFDEEPVPVAIDLQEDSAYTKVMRDVAEQLCDRRDALFSSLGEPGNVSDANFTRHRENASSREDWYSMASYCFSDLIRLRGEEFSRRSIDEKKVAYLALIGDMDSYDEVLSSRSPTSLAELEASVIVSERLREAREELAKIDDPDNISAQRLGFITERFNSAKVWSSFFDMKSPPITLDAEYLERACSERLIEAEERLKYVELYLPASYLEGASEELDRARLDRAAGRASQCLFRASKAIALSNLLGGSLSVPKDKLDSLIAGKLRAVETVIAKQEEKGFFPIIGYSYYRYASSLAEHDPYSALTFAEYALELSVLDLYFPRERGFRLSPDLWPFLLLFLGGALFGLVLGIILGRSSLTVKSKVSRSRRRHK